MSGHVKSPSGTSLKTLAISATAFSGLGLKGSTPMLHGFLKSHKAKEPGAKWFKARASNELQHLPNADREWWYKLPYCMFHIIMSNYAEHAELRIVRDSSLLPAWTPPRELDSKGKRASETWPSTSSHNLLMLPNAAFMFTPALSRCSTVVLNNFVSRRISQKKYLGQRAMSPRTSLGLSGPASLDLPQAWKVYEPRYLGPTVSWIPVLAWNTF